MKIWAASINLEHSDPIKVTLEDDEEAGQEYVVIRIGDAANATHLYTPEGLQPSIEYLTRLVDAIKPVLDQAIAKEAREVGDD